jgi:hypothetical protein
MSFMDTVRKRGAAALGVAVIASGAALTAQDSERLAVSGETYVSAAYETAALAEKEQMRATYTVTTPSGPVEFSLNDADDGSVEWAQRLFITGSIDDPDKINSFSQKDLASFEKALDQISST